MDIGDLFDTATPVLPAAAPAPTVAHHQNPPPPSSVSVQPVAVLTTDVDVAREFKEDFLDWLVNGKEEPPRAPGLHCSSLWKTCPRIPLLETKYRDYLKVETKTAGQQLTFDVGHALHDMWQNKYIGPFARLWGRWVCLACSPGEDGRPKVVHEGTLPECCPSCSTPWQYVDGTQNLVYAETFVADDDLKYCGHCDGILISRGGKKVVFEFKTISKSQFDGLKSPKFEHVIQVHAYMHALGIKQALVLYMDKGSQADWKKKPDGTWSCTNPHLKPFNVEFDQALWATMSARIRDYHKAAEMAKTLPVIERSHIDEFRRVCTSRSCDMAGDCSVRDLCFAE